MITKNMIKTGFKKGLIKIIDSPNGDGAVCWIGVSETKANWFYFGGLEAEGCSADDYTKNVPFDDIIDELYEVLDDFLQSGEDFVDEYKFYETILQENV